jgi:hypothetical protein
MSSAARPRGRELVGAEVSETEPSETESSETEIRQTGSFATLTAVATEATEMDIISRL